MESPKQHIQRIPRKGDGELPGWEKTQTEINFVLLSLFFIWFFSLFLFLLVCHNIFVLHVHFWGEGITRNTHFVLFSLPLSFCRCLCLCPFLFICLCICICTCVFQLLCAVCVFFFKIDRTEDCTLFFVLYLSFFVTTSTCSIYALLEVGVGHRFTICFFYIWFDNQVLKWDEQACLWGYPSKILYIITEIHNIRKNK